MLLTRSLLSKWQLPKLLIQTAADTDSSLRYLRENRLMEMLQGPGQELANEARYFSVHLASIRRA
jgi:hypothetical protein